MENTIETSCGDIVQISCIDSVGKVVECKFSEPVYRKILFWDIHVSNKEENNGYEFMIHTTGGCYYWINRETEKVADYKRTELINTMNSQDLKTSYGSYYTL